MDIIFHFAIVNNNLIVLNYIKPNFIKYVPMKVLKLLNVSILQKKEKLLFFFINYEINY
jgi:hypothetical protein